MADSIYIVEDRVIVSIDETHVEVISAGTQGPAGVNGLPGAQGPAGVTGATGPTGDPGDPATNLVTSAAGRLGAVTLSRSDVGLNSVDNTSDASKPVSTAQQVALDGKLDKVSIPNRVYVVNASEAHATEALYWIDRMVDSAARSKWTTQRCNCG